MKTEISSKIEVKDNWFEISNFELLSKCPIVSVLMLTYNHGAYLAEAIEGVLNQQTEFAIELLVGEDFSSDNTREIALDYQRRYPELIRVISSDFNVGVSKNFIRILNSSRGELIALCEGDDYWIDSTKLQRQFELLEKNKSIELCFHSCLLRNNTDIGLSGIDGAQEVDEKIISLETVIKGGGGFMPTASLLLRRNVFKGRVLDIIEKSPVNDYFIQVYGSQNGCFYIDKPMSVYRINVPGSLSTNKSSLFKKNNKDKIFFDALSMLKKDFPFHLKDIQNFKADAMRQAAAKAVDESNFYDFSTYLLASFLSNPVNSQTVNTLFYGFRKFLMKISFKILQNFKRK